MRILISLLLLFVFQTGIATSLSSVGKVLKGTKNIPVKKTILIKPTFQISSIAAGKNESISNLLDQALGAGKITLADKFKLQGLYAKLKTGELDLQHCLKVDKCDLYSFQILLAELPKSSSIYKKLAYKYPYEKLQFFLKKAGNINERVMSDFYTRSGWNRLEGEIGVNGIDGLFVKVKNGIVRDVLIVEGKFNTSQLGNTKNGKQMSKTWIKNHINRLTQEYPDKSEYRQIKKFIDSDAYRGIIWKMNVADGKLVINTQKAISKGSTVELSKAQAQDSLHVNKIIDINSPNSTFEKGMVNSFKNALKS